MATLILAWAKLCDASASTKTHASAENRQICFIKLPPSRGASGRGTSMLHWEFRHVHGNLAESPGRFEDRDNAQRHGRPCAGCLGTYQFCKGPVRRGRRTGSA